MNYVYNDVDLSNDIIHEYMYRQINKRDRAFRVL